MSTQMKCVYRTYITASSQKVEAKTFQIKAFCFPVFDWEIEQGYFFRRDFHAKKNTVCASDFGLKAFRINILDIEKEKFADKKIA